MVNDQPTSNDLMHDCHGVILVTSCYPCKLPLIMIYIKSVSSRHKHSQRPEVCHSLEPRMVLTFFQPEILQCLLFYSMKVWRTVIFRLSLACPCICRICPDVRMCRLRFDPLIRPSLECRTPLQPLHRHLNRLRLVWSMAPWWFTRWASRSPLLPGGIT